MKTIFRSIKNFIKETDKILLLLCMLTSAFGCVCVLSATLRTITDSSRFSRDFIVMVAAVIMGIAIAVIISMIDYEFIMRLWPVIALFCIGIMIITLRFGTGPNDRPDVKTWLKLGETGIFFQPSEIVKIGFIITFGVHLEKLKNNINHPLSILQLGIHALIPIGLVVVSGDMGSALVFIIITVAMLFTAGLHWGYFLGGGLLALAAAPLAWIFVLGDIQKNRFLALIYPDLYPNIIYQQERGLAAIGGGGITGQGLFNGTYTQRGVVPESKNDMIFSVIGEELGLIGCVAALLLLTFIVLRIAGTGRHDKLGKTKVMCYGVAAMIAGQVIINIGMCLMLLPVIGITLPFFSAGGSSNISIYFAIGLIMSFYRYNQQRELIDVSQSNINNPFMDI
ncbi:MAG: FtsW/RodA/SpoVE family cell cycle protein [Oscillospiraceae bacterium]|nr:FtsW/RodA/SpoVE family cell cycle protein [Oscillospiraceae bacterium]